MTRKNARAKKRCEQKRRYTTEARAVLAADNYNADQRKNGDGSQMQAYKCSICGQWHLGHLPRAARRAMGYIVQ